MDELKGNLNLLKCKVLNVTVFQNLSNAQTENNDISDFPVIHLTNGITLRLLYDKNTSSSNCVWL